MKISTAFTQLLLRLTLDVSFIVACFDHFGLISKYGSPTITRVDWGRFALYAHKLIPFISEARAECLAIAASAMELIFGLLLITVLFIRWTSIGSGLLLILSGVSNTVTLGIYSPLIYSDFRAGAGSLLLATIPYYKWSMDEVFGTDGH